MKISDMLIEEQVQYEIWSSELGNALRMRNQYLDNAKWETDENMKQVYTDVAFYYEGNVESLSDNIEKLKASYIK